jgi:uroporphyrinogen-III synthase
VRLLVTRPEPDGERTAAGLRARGHDVVVAPLLRMETVDFKLSDEAYGAVVMTSANAARAISRHPERKKLTSLIAFTVGRHTADAAHAVGFRDIHSADGDRNRLLDLLASRPGADRRLLLYLAGEDRAGDLAGELSAHGVRMLTVVAYRTVKLALFPPPVEAALAQGKLDGVLHFSRRSAEAYVDCAAHAGILDGSLEPLHYCLSRQVSEPLAAAGAAKIMIAAQPEETALVELIR